jgi:hypothetical protein
MQSTRISGILPNAEFYAMPNHAVSYPRLDKLSAGYTPRSNVAQDPPLSHENPD